MGEGHIRLDKAKECPNKLIIVKIKMHESNLDYKSNNINGAL